MPNGQQIGTPGQHDNRNLLGRLTVARPERFGERKNQLKRLKNINHHLKYFRNKSAKYIVFNYF
jgi:hypothetical protein